MEGWRYQFFVVLIAGWFCSSLGLAAQPLLPSRDSDTHWALVSLPNTDKVFVRSVADARRARMFSELTRMRLSPLRDILYFPDPTRLPLDIKRLTLEL